MTETVFNIKISDVGSKILDAGNLLTAPVLTTKLGKVKNKILNYSKYITTQ